MTTPLQRSRGMRDLLPGDMRAFRRVEDAFRAAASRWGYEEVRTPTIETYSLFTATGALTPKMLARVYSFLDWDGWSGERVVLRPDSTIPVSRAATQAGVPLPARLFYVQNVFRFAAEDGREEWQCGLEYLSAPPTLGDLEVAAVACETLDALGISPVVRIGHAGISHAVAKAAGPAAMAIVDGDGDTSLTHLRPAVTDPQLAALLELTAGREGDLAYLANVRALATMGLPSAQPALDEVESLATALQESGRRVVIDFDQPLDFAYYTGAVFELSSEGAVWGRGGRYSPGGESTPATACGLGLEISALSQFVSPGTRRRLSVAVVPETAAEMGRAMTVARALHRSGIAAALADTSGGHRLTVKVGPGTLVARTPDGERTMEALDDVVGLLVQYK
ncbi:MAG: ATP phosphoribosyltransferase regulatory subunit [Dehalococcoidia bacterium]